MSSLDHPIALAGIAAPSVEILKDYIEGLY